MPKKLCLIFFFLPLCLWSQAPELSASGNQLYCHLTAIPIVTDFTLVDPSNNGIDGLYIQISSGYEANEDLLSLTGTHPNIQSSWNTTEGKLTLQEVSGNSIPISDLIAAVKAVVFQSSSPTISGEKRFSITIGTANFLPETGHYYQYISDVGITWEEAFVAAENSSYFGLPGYLATVTYATEAQLVGEQSIGTGWIGGSDKDQEGQWKWMSGPEKGTVFWNGDENGSSPTFAFWNNDEPNSSGDEDYAHITAPNVGIPGSWNDLRNEGAPSGDFQPKGYVVEYGGLPGDPVLNIAASTRIYVPEITNVTSSNICDMGTSTLTASSDSGMVWWYDVPNGGTVIATGTSFTTPNLSATTVYYAAASDCNSARRTPVEVPVITSPLISNAPDVYICGPGIATLKAEASAGTVLWYESMTATTPIHTGLELTTELLLNNTTFYVAAEIDGCTSVDRTPVNVWLDETIPSFDLDTDATLCADQGSLQLEVSNPLDTYTYEWWDDEGTVIGSQPSLTVTEEGRYAVRATSQAGCVSEEKAVQVRRSEKAQVQPDFFNVIDSGDNNQIRAAFDAAFGIGSYEFAIDAIDGPYKEQLHFDQLSPGVHRVFIRDRYGCGITTYAFSVFHYPQFFTPNNDGVNDVWTLQGYDATFFSRSKVTIVNRFGKLLYKTLDSSFEWDGSYKGIVQPESDYWYTVYLEDVEGRVVERKGHFSLIQK